MIYKYSACSGLISITISHNVASIGYAVFSGCTGLTSITIPNSVKGIGYYAFSGCSSLTSIDIPNSVTGIGDNAFADCNKLENVYCHAEKVPSTNTAAFKGSYIQYATLHVPSTSINDYKMTAPWSEFGTVKSIEGVDIPKCATPTINYANKELNFSSETEGVEYVYEITDDDIKKGNANKVNLSATYNISVYATKSGYENSDVATATLVFTNATFTTEGTSSAKEMNLRPLLIQTNCGKIKIQGAEDGTRIAVYNVNGQQIGSAVSAFNTTDVSTPLKKGDVAIVKVGQRSVKVIMK